MRYKIRYPSQPPYGGMYELNLPESGMVGFGTSLDMLDTNVRKYRIANGLPNGLGLSEEIECEACKRYPAECEITDTILPLDRRLNFGDIVSGTKVIASFKKAGSPFVPKEEASRRAAICERCPLCRPFPRPCNSLCAGLKEAVDSIIGGYSLEQDTDYRACSICHCLYSTQVKFPYQFLERGLNDDQKAQFLEASKLANCWKVPGAV